MKAITTFLRAVRKRWGGRNASQVKSETAVDAPPRAERQGSTTRLDPPRSDVDRDGQPPEAVYPLW